MDARFVVLHHQMPVGADRASHWDIMLEEKGSLLTWAVSEEPLSSPVQYAKQLPDHRIEYLNYEGEVSNNRGDVVRWDEGRVEFLSREDNRWIVNLHGKKVCDRVVFERDNEQWLIHW